MIINRYRFSGEMSALQAPLWFLVAIAADKGGWRGLMWLAVVLGILTCINTVSCSVRRDKEEEEIK